MSTTAWLKVPDRSDTARKTKQCAEDICRGLLAQTRSKLPKNNTSCSGHCLNQLERQTGPFLRLACCTNPPTTTTTSHHNVIDHPSDTPSPITAD
jgi:hypothetical protein